MLILYYYNSALFVIIYNYYSILSFHRRL